MRIGIIGLGSIGKRHAANALAMGHQVYFFDPRVESQYDIVKCSHFGMMSENEAVLICTPASTHAAVAQELLSLGYTGPLFCEKPLALSSAECEVFRSWPSPVTMVGYMLRFHPDVQWLRASVPGPQAVSCHIFWDGRRYGNALLESSHEIDVLGWLGCQDALVDVECFSDASVILNFGKRSWVQIDAQAESYSRRWYVEDAHRNVTVYYDKPDELGDQMYVDELAHFLACVETNKPTITPFSDGIRVVEVCEQALTLAGASA